MGVSTHSIGRAEFFRKLYTSVGVNIRPGTERYLENQDRAFQYRKQKQKKPATKKKRNELKFQKLRIQLQELQKDRKKKHHYESGVAMLLVDTVSIVENDSTIQLVTISEPNKLPRNAAEEEAFVAAERQSLLDEVPLTVELESDMLETLEDITKEETSRSKEIE